MKELKYRKYYYGGKYTNEVMNLPNDIIIYGVNMENQGYRIDDLGEDEYTKGYLFVSKNDFSDMVDVDTIKINNSLYVMFKECIYIDDPNVNILDISLAKPIDDSYIVYKKKIEYPRVYIEVLFDNESTKEEIAEATRKLKEFDDQENHIETIEKIAAFHRNGVELVVVDMTNDYISRQVIRWSYFYFLDQRNAFVSNDKKHKDMFEDRVKQITLNVLY